MRTKVTLVLLFLNVVLFYYIFHYEEKWRDEQKFNDARRRVLGPEAAAIDSLTLSARNAPTIRATRQPDNSWQLSQPFPWPANPIAIDRLLKELQFLENYASFSVEDLPRTALTLADYGLDNPAFTLAFTAAGKTYELKVGDGTKVENRLYLLSPDGKRIHVIARAFADLLARPADELRVPALFTIPVFEVRSLGLQTTAPANLKVRLRRETGDRWAFETPILARARKAGVEATLNDLTNLRATRFLESREADPERTGLAAPALRITLEGNARRETLLIGATVPGDAAGHLHYAQLEDRPVVFTTALPAGFIDNLRTAQDKLRDPRLLDLEPTAIKALTLTFLGAPALTLQQLEAVDKVTTWQIVGRSAAGQPPRTQPADAAIVSDLLAKLTGLTARRFVSDAPSAADLENYGLTSRPEREIALTVNGPAERGPTVLQVGAALGRTDAAYARVGSAPFVYEIDTAILDATPSQALHYRDRTLRSLREGAGMRITGLKLVELGPERTVFEATNPAGLTGESLTAPELGGNLRAAAVTILGEVRDLRAKRFLAETFAATHADHDGRSWPWRYRLDVTIALSGGAEQTETSRLFLTERLAGSVQLAGTADFGGVTFEVTQPLIDALFALTFPRGEEAPAAATPAPLPAKP